MSAHNPTKFSHLFTPQGVQAAIEYEAKVAEVKLGISELIQISPNGITLETLFKSFPAIHEKAVREAMWQLLDEKILTVDAARVLIRV